ncbi:hypothetical protein OGATHE_006063 [Ogataea polymorpha]|uniref:Uncharacterized protein n=1 Tax=Ogataea polymorpha TaxID=460523 RepID=A0A9P8SYU6_9ASCO|nr:hypothetical protein OGATHE_006063 [Ogataea polymorpha]
MLCNSFVEISASKVFVVCRSQNPELSFFHSTDGNGVGGVANVDEGNLLWLLLRQICLEHTVTHSSSGDLIDDSHRIQAGNVASISCRSSLLLSVPDRNSQTDIGDVALGFLGSNVFQFIQVHGNQLNRCKLLFLSKISHLCCSISVFVDQRTGKKLLLNFEIRRISVQSKNSFQVVDCVFQVGCLLCLSCLTNGSISHAKPNDSWGASVGNFIHNNINTSVLRNSDNGAMVS